MSNPTAEKMVPLQPVQLPRGSMNFAFILWTGEDDLYARVKTFSDLGFKATCVGLIGRHSYSFGDGWRAQVEVRLVDSATKKKMLKESKGFCGYEWMIDSLLQHGDIRA